MKRNILIILGFFVLIFFTTKSVKEIWVNENEIKSLKESISYEKEVLSDVLDKTTNLVDAYNETLLDEEIVTKEEFGGKVNYFRENILNIYYKDNFEVNGMLELSSGSKIYLPVKETLISYDSNATTFSINDFFVSLFDYTEDVEENIQVFEADKEEVVFGRKSLLNEGIVSVLKVVENYENSNDIKQEVATILSGIKYLGENASYILENLEIGEEFSKRVCISKENVVFYDENDEDVVITKYDGDLSDDYFTREEVINGVLIRYGDIVSDNNSFIFYVIDFENPLLMVASKYLNLKEFFVH